MTMVFTSRGRTRQPAHLTGVHRNFANAANAAWLPFGSAGIDVVRSTPNTNSATTGLSKGQSSEGQTLVYSGGAGKFAGLQTSLPSSTKLTLVMIGGLTGSGGRLYGSSVVEALPTSATSFDMYVSGSLKFQASWGAPAKIATVFSYDLASSANVPIVYVDGAAATITPVGGAPTVSPQSGSLMLFNHVNTSLDRQASAFVAGAVVLLDTYPPAQLREFSLKPWQLFAPVRRPVYFFGPSAGAGTTVSVPVGAISVAGYAPTVTATANQIISVPAGAVTLNGYAPTVSTSASQTIAVPAGAVTLAGYAPTVTTTANQSIAVPVGAVSLTGYAPSVFTTAVTTIAVPAGAVSLAGFAPTISYTTHAYIDVPKGAVTLTGYAPTVTGGESSIWTPVTTDSAVWSAQNVSAATWTLQ